MRKKAVDILQHYFAVAMGKRSAAELSADSRSEIEDAVDCIIGAAREPAPVGPDYSRTANPTARGFATRAEIHTGAADPQKYRCPRCNAGPGAPCVDANGKTPSTFHIGRRRLAARSVTEAVPTACRKACRVPARSK